MIERVYLVAYSPSSPQRLIDIARLAYSSSVISGLVVVKPVGMAAQVGLPEAFKLAYKLGRSLVVLPRLKDVVEVLQVGEAAFIVQNAKEAPTFDEVLEGLRGTVAVVVQAGETPFTKEDLGMGVVTKLRELDQLTGSNPVAEAAIALAKIYQRVRGEAPPSLGGAQDGA